MNIQATKSPNIYVSDDYPTTLIRAIYVRNYTVMKEILRPFGITPVQWRVLANLQEFDGQNVNALAERSYTDRTNLSRAVAVLEADGMVERRREERDQRNVLVFITELGRLKFGEARPVVLQDDDFVIEGLSSSEMAMLMELLNKVKHNTYRTRRPSHIEISETINA
ncbi:MAG: MarR family transcriptional regulator [Rhodospirillaceae bacterium]|jgi:MarR family transcriptional regulator, organic hydroperoxide resistance regulator|nr:MarR family transcriptional regulator [Rhodospirillaceae bacterium]MBT4940072.1 MarR family transcriptional regulator [Rhodospirillaceae bacterium]MBT7266926.1 MarR family transcriptional regulator [Rhodospirillaceae bacterium]